MNRKLPYIITILLSITLMNCEGNFDVDNVTDAYEKFGYYSDYTGAINEAQLPTQADLEVIATTIREVINTANATSKYLTYSLTPAILFDNISNIYGIDVQDNSTCLIDGSSTITDNTTYREYPEFDINKVKDKFLEDEQIKYTNYCRQDTLNGNVVEEKVTLNGYPVESRSTADNNTLVFYMRFDENASNLKATIVDDINGFGGVYNLFGIIDKSSALDGIANSKYRLGLDMMIDGEVGRFDLNYTRSSQNRILTFYHPIFGYITSDISSITSKVVDDETYITFKYSGNECRFRFSDIANDPLEFKENCPMN